MKKINEFKRKTKNCLKGKRRKEVKKPEETSTELERMKQKTKIKRVGYYFIK